MLTPLMTGIAVFVLTSLCVGGLAVAVFYSKVVAPDLYADRFGRIAGNAVREPQPAEDDGKGRKRTVEKTLKELDEKQKTKKGNRPTLVSRMRQGGIGWSKKTYYIVCAAVGVFLFAAFSGAGLPQLPSLGFGISGGLLAPHLYVNARRKRRLWNFTSEFANAVDVLVRGLRTGLPIGDCMRIIASESQSPVRDEFVTVVQDLTLGLPMDECVRRLAERVPLAETNFFSIVIATQSKTGGSLSEALGNLSKVLRERKKMKAKIKAMSAEAVASAAIIGVLPPIVGTVVYLVNPEYMSLIFTTLIGNMVLAGCGLWMGAGILVMRKMINFDF